MKQWQTIIGLEVHAQLKSRTKLFSTEQNVIGDKPNTHVNEVCAGFPGALPVLNREAVQMAMKAGYALGCEVHLRSQFARKHYFYPDLPKGYQITQYKHPICTGGAIAYELNHEVRRCGLVRIHLEEDAGKSMHRNGCSLVDLNRAGVPLIEIVLEPELRSADEASACLKELRNILRYLDVCDGNLEEGTFRCDVNISVHQPGTPLGTRTELKNINSFRFIRKAIDYEVNRQVGLLEEGRPVVQETRLFNSNTGQTYSMRSKENAPDYRYFPDPDLPELTIDQAWAQQIERSLEELPLARRERYIQSVGLTPESAQMIVSHVAVAQFFEAALETYHGEPNLLANWVLNELLRVVPNPERDELAALAIKPQGLAELVSLIAEGEITNTIAKSIFEKMLQTGKMPHTIADEEGLRSNLDEAQLMQIIGGIVADSPEQVQQYRAGKTKVLGFLLGQVMKKTGGKAKADVARGILIKLLG